MLKDTYPFTSDYLDTLYFEQGNLDENYTDALERFLLSTKESPEYIRAQLFRERQMFYENFLTLDEQLKAFMQLGGCASTERVLKIYLPQAAL
jgi:hypothetical protein